MTSAERLSKTHESTPRQQPGARSREAPPPVNTPRAVAVPGLAHGRGQGGAEESASERRARIKAELEELDRQAALEQQEAQRRREEQRRQRAGEDEREKQADREKQQQRDLLNTLAARGVTELSQREEMYGRGPQEPSARRVDDFREKQRRQREEMSSSLIGARAPEALSDLGVASTPASGALTANERRAKREQEERDEEERKAKRKAQREAAARALQEASDREKAEKEKRPNNNKSLIGAYESERKQLVTAAESLVGRLSTNEWAQQADPKRAHVFAAALERVRSKVGPLITTVLNVVSKHRTSETQTAPLGTNVFVIELLDPSANLAAEGMALPTFVQFPIDTTKIAQAESAFRDKAKEGWLTADDMQPPRDAVSAAADKLAPTVIHEFTHLALHKAYRNASKPWLPTEINKNTGMTYAQKLGELAGTLRTWGEGVPKEEKAQGNLVRTLQKMANPEWTKRGGLKAEIKELTDFAKEAPQEVKPICELMPTYGEERQASELPSHLMEIVYLKGEDYVKTHLPQGYAVLVRLQEQLDVYFKTANVHTDWFAAHGLPAGGFKDF